VGVPVVTIRFLLAAKFIPGAGNLIGPASGPARIGFLRSLGLDAAALPPCTPGGRATPQLSPRRQS